ncbi:MAG: hypothetical protein GDA52_03785 [Rhodobacteraceae bacterium]|nr:hypothetical protein [Paracoccaceae bacterium]
MTDAKTPILGHAIFGTERGLVAQGNGVFAKAPVACYEFDRRRGGVLDHLAAGQTALFTRRLQDARTVQGITLVGTLSPCRDAQNRRGFYGAAVAVPIDAHSEFGDWSELGDPIAQLMAQARTLLGAGETLQWHRIVGQSRSDRAMEWQVVGGEILALHLSQTEWENLTTLQALNFRYGAHHTALLVFETPTPSSIPFDDEALLGVRTEFHAAKDAAQALHSAQSPGNALAPEEPVHESGEPVQGSGNGELLAAVKEIVTDIETTLRTDIAILERKVDFLCKRHEPPAPERHLNQRRFAPAQGMKGLPEVIERHFPQWPFALAIVGAFVTTAVVMWLVVSMFNHDDDRELDQQKGSNHIQPNSPSYYQYQE